LITANNAKDAALVMQYQGKIDTLDWICYIFIGGSWVLNLASTVNMFVSNIFLFNG
jgi:hypothetical protein